MGKTKNGGRSGSLDKIAAVQAWHKEGLRFGSVHAPPMRCVPFKDLFRV
jgi:hypothetical protein